METQPVELDILHVQPCAEEMDPLDAYFEQHVDEDGLTQ